ncbi:MAG: cellulase family glycosylhydrolase [Pseudomonadota bacterium]
MAVILAGSAVAGVGSVASGNASAATKAAVEATPPRFTRGINVGDYLAYPRKASWPIFEGPRTTMSPRAFADLRSMGFDFVRLAVEPTPFLDRKPRQVRDLERRFVRFMRRARAAGLGVMVSAWTRRETPRWTPDFIFSDRRNRVRFVRFLQRLAGLIARSGARDVALELMNEPVSACAGAEARSWVQTQVELYQAIRKVAPSLHIVVTPPCWSKLEGLRFLSMAPFDRRTLVDVHYYTPWVFTHQMATWSQPYARYLTGLAFPSKRTAVKRAIDASARVFTTSDKVGGKRAFVETVRTIERYARARHDERSITRDLQRIAVWGRRQGVAPGRIIVGEFGVFRPPPDRGIADEASRERWLRAVREAAASRGFGWAVYAYHSRFGLVLDARTGAYDRVMLRALGLKARGASAGTR